MIINAVNLNKSYQSGGVQTVALRDINLKIEEGEFLCIMGESGSGKSTLLNMIGLLDVPTNGSLYFIGEDISTASSRKRAFLRRNNIGFVFQSFNLIDELTVFENIELPLIYQKTPPAERQRRVERVMEKLQIAHKRNYFPNQISGGQQQRVAVARAVIGRPKLILADEPTGNLDSVRGQEVLELLVQLNEMGTTIVMVTHSQSATDYCTRTLHLFDGQIVKSDAAVN